MNLSLFSEAGLWFALRWVHLLAGVTWIGLLYYFNFVQGEYFKEADGGAKSDVIQKLVPRGLFWFRWAALATFLTGAILIGLKHLSGVGIVAGALLGTLMFLNVWLIIWPNQKIVIASTKAVAGGGSADPRAAGAGGKAALASRTNVLFSIPMLFFMASSIHLGGMQTSIHGASVLPLAGLIGVIIALELNAIFGKVGPMASVKGVIHMGLLLTAVLWALAALT